MNSTHAYVVIKIPLKLIIKSIIATNTSSQTEIEHLSHITSNLYITISNITKIKSSSSIARAATSVVAYRPTRELNMWIVDGMNEFLFR